MTSDDLRATIARLRGSVERNAVYGYRDLVIEDDDLTALLDAAEESLNLQHDIARHVAAVAAERNAALEEAAQKAENFRIARSFSLTIAAAIRALKEPTP